MATGAPTVPDACRLFPRRSGWGGLRGDAPDPSSEPPAGCSNEGADEGPSFSLGS